MLEFIRSRSQSIVIKILFVLLILSFVAWGVGDFVRGGSGAQAVANIGELSISPIQFETEYRRELENMRRLLGGNFTDEQAKLMGIPKSVLDRLIERNLLSLASHELGLAVSDNLVREEIQNLPAFQNEVGQFDRFKFNQVLQASNLTEGMLVEQLRGDLSRSMLIDSLRGAMIAPRALVDPIFTHREERRTAETFLVRKDIVTDIGAPDDNALAAFHQMNADQFTAPEYRKLTYVALRAEELAGNTAVPEERLKELYAERSADYNLPEQRHLSQVVVPDEAAARALVEGANASGELPGAVDLGVMSRDDMPLPELADVAFGLDEGQVGGPVKSSFGWHVFKVLKIEPPRVKSFEEARAELTQEVARELSIEDLYTLSTRLEDTLGGGATLEEAAQSLNLKLVQVAAVNSDGRNPENLSAEGLAADPDFLRVAFDLGSGEESPLTEFGADGYFIVRVDDVTPPTLKPLDSIRAQVIAAWTASRKGSAAQDKALALADQVRGGLPLAEAAQTVQAEVVASPPLLRSGTGSALPVTLIEALFKAAPGDVVTASGPEGTYVARLSEITVPDAQATDEKPKVAALTTAVTQEMSSDLMVQYLNALRLQYGVSVNQRVLDAAL
ncbi:SurA N-terminal domain-containing protein [Magnetospira thiophila]